MHCEGRDGDRDDRGPPPAQLGIGQSLIGSSTHGATAVKFRIGRKLQRHGPR